jgi:ribosome-associated toxin RatA of RatAB toxin-antitoxin module
MKFKLSILTLLALMMFSSFRERNHPQVDGWVLEREKKGIKIFTKKGRWSKLKDSKAIMTITAKPEEMLKMILDFDNYPNWMPRCKSAKVIAHLSNTEFIGRLVFDAPWPVADRDCVVRVKVNREPSGTIVVTQTSEPKYVKEEEGVVRIQQMVGVWKLVPKNGGTEVTNEYASNPGGSLPDWLINTQSVETPLETFESIQQKVSIQK